MPVLSGAARSAASPENLPWSPLAEAGPPVTAQVDITGFQLVEAGNRKQAQVHSTIEKAPDSTVEGHSRTETSADQMRRRAPSFAEA